MFNEKRAKPENWAPATHVSASRNLAAICSAFSAPYPRESAFRCVEETENNRRNEELEKKKVECARVKKLAALTVGVGLVLAGGLWLVS